MLPVTVVGDIAHGKDTLTGLLPDDAEALVRHKLAFAAVGAAGAAQLGGPSGEIISTAARQQSLRSIAVASTATTVAAALGADRVRSLAYKGPALAVQTTGSWVGRASADIDVLIDARDVEAADASLRALGCASRAGYQCPPSVLERYIRPERAYTGLPVTIDLHWRVDPGPGYFSARFGDLWDRRERISYDGLDVESLGAVDALLVTAVHGAKERWVRWSWILDAIRQLEPLDVESWHAARTRAAQTGASRALALCVAISTECGARNRVLPRAPSMEPMARDLLAASASAGAVEWSSSASAGRRRARWAIAASPRIAADDFARSAARLVRDRRPPWVPQQRADVADG